MSIRFKLPLALFGFLIVVIALLWILEIGMLESIYQGIQQDNITRAGTILTNHIDTDDLQEKVDQLSFGNDICILITDEQGYLVSRSRQKNCDSQIDMYSFLRRVEMAKQNNGIYLEEVNGKEAIIPGNPVVGLSDIELRDKTELQYTKILWMENSIRVLFLSTTITPLSASVETLKAILLIVTVFMSIAALILGLALSHTITRPLLSLTEKAKSLGKEEQVDFHVSGYQEVAELSATLDKAHQDLKEVERLRNELIANISHDLRTPLTMISGYAEMMRDLPDENNQENLQVILDETQYLTRLVNDVLDLSKLQANADKLTLSQFDLTLLLIESIERIQSMSHTIIDFKYDEHILIEADEMKISQVFYNFVSNAIHYSEKDSPIIIRQILKDPIVRIEVEDHGKGIAHEDLDKIWECYYRTNNDHTRNVIGSGLGLYIVKQILDMHQADYGVESELDKGSTFWFELKIKK